MIDILCEGGTVIGSAMISYYAMKSLLEDGIIPEDRFVEFELEDKTRCMVKRKSIIGFYESESAQE